jgi:electron transfer flavoprotein beta subunit
MNIVVCVKQVPDSWAEKKLKSDDHRLDREAVDAVLNDLDEYAVEAGLKLIEANGGELTVLSMGPARALESIRKALSMGADKGVHVVDDALAGSDALGTSEVLAAALKTLEFDLVLFGSESTDARMSVVPAMVAERLGLPQLTFGNTFTVEGPSMKVTRQTEDGTETVEGTLPAVVSVIEKANEPRYPSFKGIMAAKKKPMTTLALADLGLDASSVGGGAAWSVVADATQAPPRSAGTIVKDEGDGGSKLAEFLASKKFV